MVGNVPFAWVTLVADARDHVSVFSSLIANFTEPILLSTSRLRKPSLILQLCFVCFMVGGGSEVESRCRYYFRGKSERLNRFDESLEAETRNFAVIVNGLTN